MEVGTETRSGEVVLDMGSASDSTQGIPSEFSRNDLSSSSNSTRNSQIEFVIKEIQMSVLEDLEGAKVSRPSIWRAPPEFRNLDVEAFEPKVVSIGPLHRGNNRLLQEEKLKLELIRNHGLHNTSNLRRCAGIIFEFVHEARESYLENINMSDEEFVRILVVDGYFVILFLATYYEIHRLYPKSYGMKVEDLMSDIMLLENQIPLFILCKIYGEIPFLTGDFKFKQGISFFDFLRRSLPEYPIYPGMEAASHLLDIQQMLLGEGPKRDDKCRTGRGSCIRSLTDLLNAGIKLKRKPLPVQLMPFMSSCLHLSFSKGTLEIPFLSLDTQTAHMLRNLTAFEHGGLDHEQHATIYCSFMRDIIQTVDDVAILRRSGILENKLGSDAKGFEFFHSLGMGANVCLKSAHFHYYGLLQDVEEFCKVRLHSWRASFVSNYLSSPWTFLSVLAAVILLFLTATQTYFAVFPKKQT